MATKTKTEAPRDEQLKEAQEGYREQKARASELSRDLDYARRQTKAAEDKAAEVDVLEEKLEELEAELKAAHQLNDQLAKAAEEDAVNTSEVQKRADAFLAIREALQTK